MINISEREASDEERSDRKLSMTWIMQLATLLCMLLEDGGATARWLDEIHPTAIQSRSNKRLLYPILGFFGLPFRQSIRHTFEFLSVFFPPSALNSILY